MSQTHYTVIFCVTESEYPALRKLFPGELPENYADFLKPIEQGIALAGGQGPDGTRLVKADIKVADFLAWCHAAKIKPSGPARKVYAGTLALAMQHNNS